MNTGITSAHLGLHHKEIRFMELQIMVVELQ